MGKIRTTRGWQEFLNTRNYYATDFVSDTARVPGGVSIVKPGEGIIFGGIVVSGGRGDEDEALAFTGLQNSYECSRT